MSEDGSEEQKRFADGLDKMREEGKNHELIAERERKKKEEDKKDAAFLQKTLEDLREASMDPELMAEIKRRETEQKYNREVQLYRSSGIPKRYSKCLFENFRETAANKDALGICKDYVRDWGIENIECGNICIFGNIGVGKSHLAAAVVRSLISRYLVTAKYANVQYIFDLARESFDNKGANPFPALKRCRFLVLDDLGSERPTAWTLGQISNVLSKRYDDHLPTMVTSNAMSWSGLAAMITGQVRGDREPRSDLIASAQRAIDRLHDSSVMAVIKGKSWRGKTRD